MFAIPLHQKIERDLRCEERSWQDYIDQFKEENPRVPGIMFDDQEKQFSGGVDVDLDVETNKEEPKMSNSNNDNENELTNDEILLFLRESILTEDETLWLTSLGIKTEEEVLRAVGEIMLKRTCSTKTGALSE